MALGNTRISIYYARCQLILLGLAIVSSFASGTLAASASIPLGMTILIYTGFLLLFIPTVFLEWRFEKHIPLLVKKLYIGLACNIQSAAIIWLDVAYDKHPYIMLHSEWRNIRTASIVSSITGGVYLVFLIFPDLWRISICALLPERLARRLTSLDSSSDEPLLPAYSGHATVEAGARG